MLPTAASVLDSAASAPPPALLRVRHRFEPCSGHGQPGLHRKAGSCVEVLWEEQGKGGQLGGGNSNSACKEIRKCGAFVKSLSVPVTLLTISVHGYILGLDNG